MTRNSLLALGALVIVLLAAALALQGQKSSDVSVAGQRLLPEFAAVANDATTVIATTDESDGSVTLQQQEGRWVVAERSDYPAAFSELSSLIVAVANAKISEEKTSNPENYEKLGVADPEDGGNGRKLTISGDGFSHSIIFGELAQGNQRYARLANEEASYLIDQNPDIPDSPGEWLIQDLLDIDSDRLRRVSISHADGEKIVLEKASREQTDFVVLDIPEDRTLTYPTVANGVAGALSDLVLEDVRSYAAAMAATSDSAPLESPALSIFETWDGLTVSIEMQADGEQNWATFSATAQEIQQQAIATTEAPSSAADLEEEGAADEMPDFAAILEEAADLNDRLNGWQYLLPGSKQDLLLRRWDDILQPAE